jgi:hypothetical protein
MLCANHVLLGGGGGGGQHVVVIDQSSPVDTDDARHGVTYCANERCKVEEQKGSGSQR